MTVLHAVCLSTVSVYYRKLIFIQIIDRKDFRSRIPLLLHNIYSAVMRFAVSFFEGLTYISTKSVYIKIVNHYVNISDRRHISNWSHRTTIRKVAGSITDSFIFNPVNSSGSTTTLGSTQHVTYTSTRDITWGVKAAGAYGLQLYHLHVPIVLTSGSLNLLEPSWPLQDCRGIALPVFTY